MEIGLGGTACVADGAVRLPPPRFAAIDLGTNNCRLLVGSPSRGGVRVLDSFSRIVRLGEGLHDTGRLSQGGMERAIAALAPAPAASSADRCARCARSPPKPAAAPPTAPSS